MHNFRKYSFPSARRNIPEQESGLVFNIALIKILCFSYSPEK